MTEEKQGNPGWLAQGSTDSEEVAKYYDDWAEGYDASLMEWGYDAPIRAAELLSQRVSLSSRVLDAGCGTGLTGRALHRAGFKRIDGMDISEHSLRLADRTGAYDHLFHHDLQQKLPLEDDTYDALQCIGVLTYIAEAAALLREFCRVVRRDGILLFSQRDDLYEARDFPAMLAAFEREGILEVLETTEPQPYLPHNEDFGDSTLVIFTVCRVTGA